MGFCDVRDPAKETRWLPGFLLSMAWLAGFSYLMCYSADRITESFGIPSALMGVTVCAVGTSFPNFYASLIMAKAGRSSMAIANALGSNIQNIFIALALPWVVRTMVPSPHLFFVGSAGIFANVLAMAVTLLVLLVLVARGRMALDRTAGYVLIGT
ncbi:hypothetical protein FOZ62_005181 [Perkinsus olseni]|uniref:Sodium/calcium exchanger membrane region domain-containing protein n=2 Tax=Perkinsus olseni TaxID=32597 RepID=A0A7J6TC12_PEROL|nr:hypothetical protein FOZ62_005181 [Perkinsus olseni]